MLSERLKMVAGMVAPCDYLADIGTDHAYLPIYLIKNGTVKRAVAADISAGSCEKAQRNITANKLNSLIEVRCGNGLAVMGENEIPDTIVIAGMGGMLAIDVLKSHISGSSAQCLVLQVQRDIYAVRKHLHKTGYIIADEQMLKEDGKVYIAILAKKGGSEQYSELEYHFGRFELMRKSPVLKEYIEIEHNKIVKVLNSLLNKHSEEIEIRKAELNALAALQEEALKCL